MFPLLTDGEKDDVAMGACLARSCCGDSLAQRHFHVRMPAGPVLLKGVKSLTSKEVSYIRLTQDLDGDP
jgi:hypothetical protein